MLPRRNKWRSSIFNCMECMGHPSDLEMSPSVKLLKLTIHSLGSIPFDMAKKLRVISFKDVMFLDVKLMKNFENVCPLLEDLRLLSCP